MIIVIKKGDTFAADPHHRDNKQEEYDLTQRNALQIANELFTRHPQYLRPHLLPVFASPPGYTLSILSQVKEHAQRAGKNTTGG